MTKPVQSILTFLSGGLVTGLIGWTTIPASARQATSATPGLHVCVAPDGVLRVVDASAACPAAERSMLLPTSGADRDSTKDASKNKAPTDPNAGCADPTRVAQLKQQLEDLEATAGQSTLGSRVIAPFEVVDRDGKRVFRVDEGVVALFNTNGKAVAQIHANPTGGYFSGTSADSEMGAAIGAVGDQSGLRIYDKVTRVDLGRDPQFDTYRAKFFNKAGTLVAGMGQSQSSGGGGAALIFDSSGELRAAVDLANSDGFKGRVAVWSKNHEIATLTEAKAGGLLAIYGSGGQRMVEAGVLPDGVGIVRAGPDGFSPGVGLLGLPGSFIMGKK